MSLHDRLLRIDQLRRALDSRVRYLCDAIVDIHRGELDGAWWSLSMGSWCLDRSAEAHRAWSARVCGRPPRESDQEPFRVGLEGPT